VAHPKSPLTETVTLVEIEDSHSMMEVEKAVTQTAPDAELRLEPTPKSEQTALGRRSATQSCYSSFDIIIRDFSPDTVTECCHILLH